MYALLLTLTLALGGRVSVEASATPPAWVVAQTGTDLRRGDGEIRGYWHCQNPRYEDCRIWVSAEDINIVVHEMADVYGFVELGLPDNAWSVPATANPAEAIKQVNERGIK